jgi:oxygen-dependent protoporphyrinogen oxidase
VELGLERDLITSSDATRRTYILIDGQLQAMPDRMRMMVPEDLATLEHSALFSAAARAAYAAEPARAEELRSSAPDADESVASFVLRHFGPEVLARIAAPLLSGVFGGDVEKLSVRAVMPAFVAMERDHGSLVAALQARAKAHRDRPQQPIFTSLRHGLGSLIERLVATLPADRIHCGSPISALLASATGWLIQADPTDCSECSRLAPFDRVLCATSLDTARKLLAPLDPGAAALLPTDASSAVLASFCWRAEAAARFSLPQGFGFLVPRNFGAQNLAPQDAGPEISRTSGTEDPQLLACTFVDQKFPDRCPAGARVVRVFFGGAGASALASQPDAAITATALRQLQQILQPGAQKPLPAPEASLITVRRWPRSLPQYEVGHLERMAELDARVATLGGLALLGNSYRGVGLPDLIRAARQAARSIIEG